MTTSPVLGEWHVIAGPRVPQRSLPSVGVCIYCPSTATLEDEHIIPDGIGGDLILRDASCRVCAEKINRWEQEAQTRYLGATRDSAGVKSRKRRGNKPARNRRYRAVAAAVKEGEDPRDKDRGPEITDPGELPKMVMVETTMGRPELLGGAIPGNGICMAMSWLKEHGPEECTIDYWARGGDFLRLLAKIGHGFAVATVGLDAFTSVLADIILMHDHDDSDLWKYIGGQSRHTKTTDLHRVRLRTDVAKVRSPSGLGTTFSPVFVADIQLFANYSAPIFEVVVGFKRNEPKAPV